MGQATSMQLKRKRMGCYFTEWLKPRSGRQLFWPWIMKNAKNDEHEGKIFEVHCAGLRQAVDAS